MRVLVTGGCGFIGHHLCRRLVADGADVSVLDDLSTGDGARLPAESRLHVGDVADPEAVDDAMHAADACVHLAAIASVPACQADWHRATAVNLLGSVNVFAAAARHGNRPVVYASSAAVYGPADPPIAETDPTQPLSNYGCDKLASEWHAAAAGRANGLPTVGLRFFNVFGPGQDPRSPYSGVITHFHTALAEGRPPLIHGDGQQTRDFIYVDDVVDAIARALQSTDPSAPVLNVCTGHEVDLLSLARTMSDISGQPLAPSFGPPRPGDIQHSRGDPRRAADRLGFRAAVSLRDGLQQLIGCREQTIL